MSLRSARTASGRVLRVRGPLRRWPAWSEGLAAADEDDGIGWTVSVGLLRRGIQATQHSRTMRQPAQAMAWPGHTSGQAPRRLPGRTPPRRHPHPGRRQATASAIDYPARVRRPGSRADKVLHDPERLTDGHGVLVRILVVLSVGKDEPRTRSHGSWLHGMLAGITVCFEQHHHRPLGIRHEGRRSPRRTARPCLHLTSVDPRPKRLQHHLGRHGDGAVVIDHP